MRRGARPQSSRRECGARPQSSPLQTASCNRDSIHKPSAKAVAGQPQGSQEAVARTTVEVAGKAAARKPERGTRANYQIAKAAAAVKAAAEAAAEAAARQPPEQPQRHQQPWNIM